MISSKEMVLKFTRKKERSNLLFLETIFRNPDQDDQGFFVCVRLFVLRMGVTLLALMLQCNVDSLRAYRRRF